MLNIALPKGRLGDKTVNLLSKIGYNCCNEKKEDTRKLIFENNDLSLRFLLVKPSDVSIYVEHGAADVGIVGKDILFEEKSDVYELVDLKLGRCRMCVAAKQDFKDNRNKRLRVATKYVNVAKEYYLSQGRDIDIIKLNGSIELAPILNLSDVIVDIVESGNTIRENNLKILSEFMEISAIFIANKSSYRFKYSSITEMADKLIKITEGAEVL